MKVFKKVLLFSILIFSGVAFCESEKGKSPDVEAIYKQQNENLKEMCANFSENENLEPVVFLFAHGLWGSKKQATWYAPTSDLPDWYLFTCPYEYFDFPDVGEKRGEVKAEKVNIGQELDVNTLIEQYENTVRKNPGKKVVLIGQSRGAMTIINALAEYPDKFKEVKALVLESPAADPVEATKNYLNYVFGVSWLGLSWLSSATDPLFKKALNWYYEKYDPEGLKPVNSILKISKNLPILFIHSKQDELTPLASPKKLWNLLKAEGHDKVYFLTLEKGLHGKYNCSPKLKDKKCLESAKIYRDVIHLFYEKYGIPYNKEFAKQAREFLQYHDKAEEILVSHLDLL